MTTPRGRGPQVLFLTHADHPTSVGFGFYPSSERTGAND